MKSPLTTLCYLKKDDSYLLLHRVKKNQDVNKGKWIGVGGHFEEGESPEECLLREVREETGLTLTSYQFRGIVTFVSNEQDPEYMCLYTADAWTGELSECNEGVLEWVPRDRMFSLPMWEGDKIFFRLIDDDAPFFSLKLCYEGSRIVRATLEGRELELFDIADEKGEPTGLTCERNVAHTEGIWHRTVHIWLVRCGEDGKTQVLLQKRSAQKDAFPGCWDISSAGHCQAGFDFYESAVRELQEEIGIDAKDFPLVPAYRTQCIDDRVFRGKPFHNREVAQVYLCFCDLPESEFHLQVEELDEVRWFGLRELMTDLEAGNRPDFIVGKAVKLLADWLEREYPGYEK